MTSVSFDVTDASSSAQRAVLVRLWLGAAAIGALSAAVIFDASPGLNWLMCVAAASIALLMAARARGSARHVAPPIVLAFGVAIGMVMTASEPLQALSILTILILVATAIARTQPVRYVRAPAATMLALPVVVFATCVVEATRRVTETVRELANERAVPLIRGLAITLPITGLFALLLSSVDPTLSQWVVSIDRFLSNLAFLPRLVFFGVVLGLSLGALGYALTPLKLNARPTAESKPLVPLGETERVMVLGAIAGLFTLFLTLQVSYLFGDVARTAGSGISYAEWARRGFGELTVVATLCGGVILFLAVNAPAELRRRRILILELVVLGETQVLLFSAFRRVLLYEDAYGFTTTRLYAQVYMMLVAASLVLLAHELLRQPSARRLLGRAGALAVIGLAGLSMWNHEGWIVRQNVARYEKTGILDSRYLACELSAGAVPEVLRAAEHQPASASRVRAAIGRRFAGRPADSWYEWNAGRSRARDAIVSSGIAQPAAGNTTSLCLAKWD